MLRVKFEGGISTIALLERIREVINKRIQEKKKNEFTDLAPIDDIENGAEYLKALHWAIKKEKVKNIALAGPYGAGKSTHIAQYLLQIDVKISISVFNTAWTYLLTDEIKNKLMLKYCSILNAPDFEECFSELSKIYPKFGDRSKRHNAEMANTNENKKLADRLKEVGYITSYTEQEKDDFDPVKGTGGKKNIISCWIKMVKM